MEHGQETGESIGAMLSSIAAVLREVSDKLDAVAARVDGVDTVSAVSIVPADHSIEARLAKLEAWAFRAGQDISGIDGRLEQVESGGAPSPAAASHAAPETAERPLPRAASRRNSVNSVPAEQVVQRESASATTTPTARESIGSSHDLVQPARDTTSTARENAAATRESVSRRYDSTPRDTAPARDSAAHEANSVPQRSFSTPREPVPYEPTPAPAPNFTAPTPREPSPAQSANFTAPTPREPLPVRQSSFTAPREPAGSSYQNFTSPHENSYESMIPSAPDSADYSRGTNGAKPETNGSSLTGAHRADEDLIPVDNSHVDKLQAMLDELKKTAAAPLGRSDVFGPPATDLNSTTYAPERSTETPRDYRLSSPPK
ncbi:hypothetical protein F3087_32835 [Nocardia colli]|uniref:Uncharacterized protein n=1 Tax=Nocardia colli TaxID=2545717 RepID=A0A5N0E5R1_9NOCA|nr:hypothetical protein [Nocardia colli]KAA8884758.1 hypothetical protein F3087_32835 [Nocardia colli]